MSNKIHKDASSLRATATKARQKSLKWEDAAHVRGRAADLSTTC